MHILSNELIKFTKKVLFFVSFCFVLIIKLEKVESCKILFYLIYLNIFKIALYFTISFRFFFFHLFHFPIFNWVYIFAFHYFF